MGNQINVKNYHNIRVTTTRAITKTSAGKDFIPPYIFHSWGEQLHGTNDVVIPLVGGELIKPEIIKKSRNQFFPWNHLM